MRPTNKKNKIAVVAASAALLAAGGGAAYAYWSTTGSGSGSAAAETGTENVKINVSFEQGITPGGEAKTINYTAVNPNSSSTPVTLSNPVVTTSNAGCLPAWFEATVPSGTTTVPAYVTSHPLGTGTLTFSDDPEVNQDACKGATITVSVSSN